MRISTADRRRLHTHLGKWYTFADVALALPDFQVISYDARRLTIRVHFAGQADAKTADLPLFLRAIRRGALLESDSH